ncbi:MAG: hypothetical protein ACRENI_11720 [Gemmatimonadaceae bacterium]
MSRILSFLAVLVLSGCLDTELTLPELPPFATAFVLNGTGNKGITIVPDSGNETRHISFGDAFDGAVFTGYSGTILATSSRDGGDQLFVADINTETVETFQLPAGSNPAGATPVLTLFPGAPQRSVAVALRDSQAIALVDISASADPDNVTLFHGAGQCPVDVLVSTSSLYSLDANQSCRTTYDYLGPSRIISISPDGDAADTLSLGDDVFGAQRLFANFPFVLVFASGDFAGRPATVTLANVLTDEILETLSFPAGVYGVNLRGGLDGLFYATAFEPTQFEPFSPRVYAIDASRMVFAGLRVTGEDFLALTKEDASAPLCSAATADGRGQVYCVENGSVLSNVIIFDPEGNEIRRVPSGSLAFDIQL